tara:strand:- start:405 stop:605 length:201 start_codon:yes stop_codon:yes gene_type:complete
MTLLSKKDAADVLSMSEDELMFAVQLNKIQAGVDDDTLAWTFVLEDVLKLKQQIEDQQALDKQEDA